LPFGAPLSATKPTHPPPATTGHGLVCAEKVAVPFDLLKSKSERPMPVIVMVTSVKPLELPLLPLTPLVKLAKPSNALPLPTVLQKTQHHP
jgi:hypothetical protein